MNTKEKDKAALAVILQEIKKGSWPNNRYLQNLGRRRLRFKKSTVQLNARTSAAEKRISNIGDNLQNLTGIKKNVTPKLCTC